MMRIYTLDEVQDEFIGKIGTPERDQFKHTSNVTIEKGCSKKSKQPF